MSKYKAEFLWPHEEGSVEEMGYEFVNAKTEKYRQECWNELIQRVKNCSIPYVVATEGKLPHKYCSSCGEPLAKKHKF